MRKGSIGLILATSVLLLCVWTGISIGASPQADAWLGIWDTITNIPNCPGPEPDESWRGVFEVSHDGDGDWALLIRVNGEALEEERIIAGAEGWQDLSFDLSAFSGKTVDIEIEGIANDWFYEYVFFDYIRIDTMS